MYRGFRDIRPGYRAPTDLNPAVPMYTQDELQRVPALAMNNHLPIHADPYFNRIQANLGLYGNSIIGVGDELHNQYLRSTHRFGVWSTRFPNFESYPWLAGGVTNPLPLVGADGSTVAVDMETVEEAAARVLQQTSL